jgi:hypothetical protein
LSGCINSVFNAAKPQLDIPLCGCWLYVKHVNGSVMLV